MTNFVAVLILVLVFKSKALYYQSNSLSCCTAQQSYFYIILPTHQGSLSQMSVRVMYRARARIIVQVYL